MGITIKLIHSIMMNMNANAISFQPNNNFGYSSPRFAPTAGFSPRTSVQAFVPTVGM